MKKTEFLKFFNSHNNNKCIGSLSSGMTCSLLTKAYLDEVYVHKKDLDDDLMGVNYYYEDSLVSQKDDYIKVLAICFLKDEDDYGDEFTVKELVALVSSNKLDHVMLMSDDGSLDSFIVCDARLHGVSSNDYKIIY